LSFAAEKPIWITARKDRATQGCDPSSLAAVRRFCFWGFSGVPRAPRFYNPPTAKGDKSSGAEQRAKTERNLQSSHGLQSRRPRSGQQRSGAELCFT